MADYLIGFLVALAFLAMLTRETFVLSLLYLLVLSLAAGRWWSGRVTRQIQFVRKFDRKVFPDEIIPVKIEIQNKGWLPAIWLRVQDYYPLEVADIKGFQQVISLGPRETAQVQYNLKSHKRGYYTIGPLSLATGDLLGLSNERSSEGVTDHLTVYPRVIQFTNIKLPSHSPMGTLRTTQPIFEDSSRPMGKRDYQAGDSLRRIDWKATAVTGRLQTRLFEPSIALETMLFLDLNTQDYFLRSRFDAAELAVVITASLANWVVAQRQSVGLITNALDALTIDNQAVPLPSRKGRGHLMRILDILARARAIETTPFSALIRQHRVNLSWGTTLLVITGSADQALMDELNQAHRSGLNPVLILCGEHPGHRQATLLANLYHIPVHIFLTEKDLDVWRK